MAYYCGWIKLGDDPWRQVCTAESQKDCERILLNFPVPPGTRLANRVVLPGGERPKMKLRPSLF